MMAYDSRINTWLYDSHWDSYEYYISTPAGRLWVASIALRDDGFHLRITTRVIDATYVEYADFLYEKTFPELETAKRVGDKIIANPQIYRIFL